MISRERRDDERALLAAWGEVFRRYRQWKGLSRRELAQRARLSPVFLGEIERGEKDLSSHSICLLADALGAPVTELLLRVAASLEGAGVSSDAVRQMAIPRMVRERPGDDLEPAPQASDDTAFDLYQAARQLRAEQQVPLLLLARSLARQD